MITAHLLYLAACMHTPIIPQRARVLRCQINKKDDFFSANRAKSEREGWKVVNTCSLLISTEYIRTVNGTRCLCALVTPRLSDGTSMYR